MKDKTGVQPYPRAKEKDAETLHGVN